MRAIPRALTATLVGAVLVLFSAPTGAQEGDGAPAPRAEAQATALRLSLFGNEVVVSAADTAADSSPSGSALGTGAFLATEGVGQSEAFADSDNPTAGSPDPVCGDLALPADIPLPIPSLPDLPVVVACSTAEATASEGAGTATATGLAVELNLGSSSDLEALGLPPLNEVIPVDELDALDPILDPIFGLLPPGTLPDYEVIKAGLAAALSGDVTVLRITAGTTESASAASGTASSATASAVGVTIDLLVTALGPLATIEIGASSATATFQDGVATADHVVAPVTITPGAALVAAGLPAPPDIPVPEGQVIDLPLPDPLQSRITVSGGEDVVDGVSARSTGAAVRLDLFTGLPDGGVVLAASDTAAAVEGVEVDATPPPPAQPPTQVNPAPPTGRDALPRTGGDGRWIPVGVLLGVAAAVSFVTLRRQRSAPQA